MPELREQVMSVLVRYFDYLEAGQVDLILPDPTYIFRHYGDMDTTHMRQVLQGIEEYCCMQVQMGYANGLRRETFDAGPDYTRLPEPAMTALFQELDAIFAQKGH